MDWRIIFMALVVVSQPAIFYGIWRLQRWFFAKIAAPPVFVTLVTVMYACGCVVTFIVMTAAVGIGLYSA
jgi:hypothetical protein